MAVQRYDKFDGETWTSNDGEAEWNDAVSFSMVQVGKQVWFKPASVATEDSIYEEPKNEALKFANYRSPVIPTCNGLSMWCIDMVERSDFFSISRCGTLRMNDRSHVPDYTVVRFVNRQMDLERIEAQINHHALISNAFDLESELRDSIKEQLRSIEVPSNPSWGQVQSVVTYLRKHFQVLPREANNVDTAESSEVSLVDFIRAKRGEDYHFATLAALMLNELGYETRMVTGFYVRPRFLASKASEVAIVKDDLHAWLEIRLSNGEWVPLEPTPGYAMPDYRKSLWYRTKQASPWILLFGLVSTGTVVTVYLMRRVLFDVSCRLAWYFIRFAPDKQRVSWLSWIIDHRLKLLGKARPCGAVPCTWLLERSVLPEDLRESIVTFFADSDRLAFGRGSSLSLSGKRALRDVWQKLTIRQLRSQPEA